MPSARMLISLAVAFLFALRPSFAASTVRVSFLTDRAALQDMLGVLGSAGCTRDATAMFKRAVEAYNSTPAVFDFGKFPKARDGFYAFNSAAALVKALPHPFASTQHAYDFNCFTQ